MTHQYKKLPVSMKMWMQFITSCPIGHHSVWMQFNVMPMQDVYPAMAPIYKMSLSPREILRLTHAPVSPIGVALPVALKVNLV